MASKVKTLIKKDRLRFTKNKLSAGLILAAIAINALYFVSIYRSDVGSYYYNLTIGVSILYNLIFMLIAFLSSEGVKNYKIGYAYAAIVLGIVQIGRIFVLPSQAHAAQNTVVGKEAETVMLDDQFGYVAICLCLSAALLICAGVIGIIKTTTLRNYQAELDKKNEGNNQ
ncbi:MAG: hypothetical protein II820_05890 [Ruminiclostridium sp.]|nr:hypothetical protein [Ruminiclostridium sp.]